MDTLGSQAVGAIVKLNVNGTARNFIVVNQGLPGSTYDSSCDGTWLLMEDLYETRRYGTNGDYTYKESEIHKYLNNDFINLLDANIRNIIKQVKIPYRNSTGTGMSVARGANGLSTKVFLLSLTETDAVAIGEPKNVKEGSALAYFKGATDSKRIAYLDGSAHFWLLRSTSVLPSTSYTQMVTRIEADGSAISNASPGFERNGVRPALVLPTDTNVAGDGTIVPASGTITSGVNIGGVLRNLTGGGYVNIGGVLRPITIVNFNIGGVMMSGWYTWKKYVAAETITSYAPKTDEDVTVRSFHTSQNVTTYKSISFDESTGKFTLSQSIQKNASSISLSYPYYGSSGNTEVYKLTAKKGSSGSGTKLYYMYEQIIYYSEPVIAYSQGTYIEDVTSPNETAYPENGRHTDGYWYVKQ